MTEEDDFDPYKADRPPREEGWEQETEQIINLLRNRGDQRIGQLLINAVRKTHHTYDKDSPMSEKEIVEQILWDIEAPELLEGLNELKVFKGEQDG
jgi:hypothetical protein